MLVRERTTPGKRAAPTGNPSGPPSASKRRKRNTTDSNQDYSDPRIALSAVRDEAASSGQPYLSTRSTDGLLSSVPSLVSISLRRASSSAMMLYANHEGDNLLKKDISYERDLIRLLPPHLASSLFRDTLNALAFNTEALKEDEGIKFAHENISTAKQSQSVFLAEVIRLFLHPPSSTSFALPLAVGSNFQISVQIQRDLLSCRGLTVLNLTGQRQISDTALASILSHLPVLEELVLRSCTSVGDKSIQAIASPNIRICNLNYTAVTFTGISSMLTLAPKLQVLKLANSALNDKALNKIIDHITTAATFLPLANLTNLKLRSTGITEVGLGRLLALSPNLERLDISFTQTRTLDFLSAILALPNAFKLQKLLLSGLTLKRNSLPKFFSSFIYLKELQVLKLGSMGQAGGTVFSGEADQMDPVNIKGLTEALKHCQKLESLGLHGNPRLMNSVLPVRELLSTVGRKCMILDLSYSINTASPHAKLRADVLEGLLGVDDTDKEGQMKLWEPSKLQVLLLDGTRCADECAQVIAQMDSLESLHLKNSTLTVDGLSTILESCKKLSTLDLSRCRGIPTAWRRDVFTIFDQGKLKEASTSSRSSRRGL